MARDLRRDVRMFGAAGAPATRFGDTLGIMSAQAVLSMIAPALPATPQGASGADAAAFQGLLASMLAAGGVSGAEAPGAPADDEPGSGSLAESDDTTAVEGSGMPGFLVAAPAALPTGFTSPGPSELPADGGVAGQPRSTIPYTPGAEGLATSPSPEGAPTVKTSGPPLPPGAGDPPVLPAPPVVGESYETAPPSGSAEAPPAGAEPSKLATAGAPPVAAPPAPGAPLRPLTERTARALDDNGAAPVAAEPVDPKGASSKAVEPAPQPPAQPARPPVVTAGPLSAPDAAAPPPDQAAPTGETSSSAADTAAPVREHAFSALSRAAIDATAQIAAQIQRKLDGRSTRFEIALRPDDLGRVDVKLDIDAEGRLAARLAFDNPVAATELRGRVDDLRRQLENAGFQLADDAFEFAERDSGSSAFDRGHDPSRGQNRAFAAAARLNNEIDAGQPARWIALALTPEGVDMKV